MLSHRRGTTDRRTDGRVVRLSRWSHAGPDVSDVLVNGPNEVYVERMGQLHQTSTVFADDEHLMQIIRRVVAGRAADDEAPMVDASCPTVPRKRDHPPLALNGPVLSIRRFGHEPLKLADLLAFNSICPEMVAAQAAIEARINLMISGGTGAGKTTLLNCLSAAFGRRTPGDDRRLGRSETAAAS